MKNILLVGAGGFLGSVARYLLAGWVHRIFDNSRFPWGTATVNLLGCFLIGLLAGLAETRQVFSGETRLFLLVGILGGFTTFSTFGYETFTLARDAQFFAASLNVLGQVALGLAAVWLGFAASRAL